MAINIPPFVKHPVAQTSLKILNLEASQLSFPESQNIMKGAVAAYAVAQTAAQSFEHSMLASVLYGLASAGVAVVWTYYLLRYLKQDDKFVRTLIAVAGFGALAATVYCVLHVIFGIALPDPMPTKKLLRFLLFPIIVWLVFIYAFFYRHVSLRPIPAFFTATFYVLIVEIIMAAVQF